MMQQQEEELAGRPLRDAYCDTHALDGSSQRTTASHVARTAPPGCSLPPLPLPALPGPPSGAGQHHGSLQSGAARDHSYRRTAGEGGAAVGGSGSGSSKRGRPASGAAGMPAAAGLHPAEAAALAAGTSTAAAPAATSSSSGGGSGSGASHPGSGQRLLARAGAGLEHQPLGSAAGGRRLHPWRVAVYLPAGCHPHHAGELGWEAGVPTLRSDSFNPAGCGCTLPLITIVLPMYELQALRRSAHAAASLLATLEAEVPDTAATLRLSGMELADCIGEMGALRWGDACMGWVRDALSFGQPGRPGVRW